MPKRLFRQHEIDYIKSNSENQHLVDVAYVPKEVTTDTGKRYIFYLRDGRLDVFSKQVERSECTIAKWT